MYKVSGTLIKKLSKTAEELDRKSLIVEADILDGFCYHLTFASNDTESELDRMKKIHGCPVCGNLKASIKCKGCNDTGFSLPGDRRGNLDRMFVSSSLLKQYSEDEKNKEIEEDQGLIDELDLIDGKDDDKLNVDPELIDRLESLVKSLEEEGLDKEADLVDALAQAISVLCSRSFTCSKCGHDEAHVACQGCGDTGHTLFGSDDGLIKRAGLWDGVMNVAKGVGNAATGTVGAAAGGAIGGVTGTISGGAKGAMAGGGVGGGIGSFAGGAVGTLVGGGIGLGVFGGGAISGMFAGANIGSATGSVVGTAGGGMVGSAVGGAAGGVSGTVSGGQSGWQAGSNLF